MTPLATLFGLGRAAPFAAGTFGSLAALPVAWLLHTLGGAPLFLAGLVAAIVLGHLATAAHLATTSDPDPSEVIVDELAGQLLALSPLSLGLWLAGSGTDIARLWPGWVMAFVLFRALDILKPWPISRAEDLPGAWGVMADDLVAGALAALAVAAAAALAHA